MLSNFRETKQTQEKPTKSRSLGGAKLSHKRQSSQHQMKSMLKDWVRACISRPPYNVTIRNLSKSWGDGLAFAALVHSLSTVGSKKEPYSWASCRTATPLHHLSTHAEGRKCISCAFRNIRYNQNSKVDNWCLLTIRKEQVRRAGMRRKEKEGEGTKRKEKEEEARRRRKKDGE